MLNKLSMRKNIFNRLKPNCRSPEILTPVKLYPFGGLAKSCSDNIFFCSKIYLLLISKVI